MGYRERHCNLEKFIIEHVDDSCWQFNYIFGLINYNEDDMLKVCAKCIYFKGDKEDLKCQ
jgi:hypothetical protein